jgi:peptide/nickel transport system substrate-binding protein
VRLKRPISRAGFALATTLTLAVGVLGCGSSSDSGTLRVTYAAFPDALDPALAFSGEGFTAMYDTYIPLLTYAHANGKAGSKVIPGLARSLPKISADGKTYTLFLRQGLKYSDGTPVKASDFTHSIERLFLLNSPGSPFYTDIVGAEKFAESKQGGIPGIETDEATGKITIHLAQPRGTFSNELGLLFASVLPGDTPDEDLSANPPPATGPYEIVSSQPGRGWKYERNPHWLGGNAELMPHLPSGHVNRIEVDVIRNEETQVNDVEGGDYEWMQNSPPLSRYAQVKDKYEETQFRVEPQINVYYFWMNTTQVPFSDPEVRKAVNHAVNAEALERIYAGQIAPSQQILPRGMPGYERFELYPYDLAKAKRMIAAADPADREVTVWTNDEGPSREAAEYYEDVLRQIGFEPTLKVVNADNYFTIVSNTSTPELDTGWGNWFEDYPHPNDFFQPLLSGESIAPTGNSNWAQIDDPKLNAEIARLGREQLGPRQEREYAELDRAYMEHAPWAPYGNLTVATFVSSAIDLDQVVFNPTFGQDLTSFQFK